MTSNACSVVRQDDAKVFYEGPELCREYLRNESMWFGTSVVNPGEVGAVDPGHDGAWEVFYCAAGEAILDDGTNEYTLHVGDALTVPPNVPHRIHNRGTETVVCVWAGGPGEPAQ
jgi:mannose-6-phosphate isomerase-like protein (cupin superfamily)